MAIGQQSILTSVKKLLGLAEDYTAFDLDVILQINSALSTLTQLGIGPELGFSIEDATATWDDFLMNGHERFNSAKTYVALRVRLVFDPPTTSYTIAAFQKEIAELEWRLNVTREATQWVNPDPRGNANYDLIVDGGDSSD